MSAFVMVLAAGMAVGSGPDGVSAEAERGLDLRGAWKGDLRSAWGEKKILLKARVEMRGPGPEATLYLKKDGEEEESYHLDRVTDEGDGRFRIEREMPLLGIYKWQGEQLVLCFRTKTQGRPTAFQAGGGSDLLTLSRVKPSK